MRKCSVKKKRGERKKDWKSHNERTQRYLREDRVEWHYIEEDHYYQLSQVSLMYGHVWRREEVEEKETNIEGHRRKVMRDNI